MQSARKKFTPEEDQRLIQKYNEYRARGMRYNFWQQIAQSFPGRTPEQCRDRYTKYLSHENQSHQKTNRGRHSTFTPEEDTRLIQLYREHGPHWWDFTQHFHEKTGQQLADRFNHYLKPNLQGPQMPVPPLAPANEMTVETNNPKPPLLIPFLPKDNSTPGI